MFTQEARFKRSKKEGKWLKKVIAEVPEPIQLKFYIDFWDYFDRK